jgi:predicted ATPase/class 3 adenylate cyclase
MAFESVRAGAPTGTVAFVFSDVEASTRRWERYGDAMRDALRLHDEILRAEIESRRGYVFKTIGDAFCAAFWSVAEALDAAVAAQRRLNAEDFSAVGGLGVRMALHAGETDERYGDYFGVPVNRTARLLSAGHGGQILLSSVAADLAGVELPAGITLRHLGELTLRDLKEPEHVYQAVGPGLRSEFEALHALETPPNNLPRQNTSFVGRHDEVTNVETMLERGGLVTIVGAGGIGKTRLAIEVAASRINDRSDGVWIVDLSSIGDASLISATILSTLGGERSGAADALGDLLKYLEKRELLLVLDNSEHLVSDVAHIVAQIVARCSRVAVLATSRQPLDITAERLYRLSSLDLAAAMELFADRARAADATFRAETKSTLIEEICSRLDGIALAIELAAARVRTMSVQSLAAHLELRLLSGGRDRRPRQQTMQSLIDWSYDLLSEEERAALRRCAVFLRGFTLRSAADLWGEGDAAEVRVLDLLASLVDKSLVVAEPREGEQRYRLLEPIREYALEALTRAGELEQSLQRHADSYAKLATRAYEEWDRGPGADWLPRLELELANVRAARRFSVEEGNGRDLGARLVADTTVMMLRLGLLDEGIAFSERVLSNDEPLPPPVEARLRYGCSMLYSNLGQNQKVLASAKLAASLYRTAGDPRGLARALSQVAARYAARSEYDRAKPAAEEALALARRGGDARLLADTLRRCADAFAVDGAQRVRDFYDESVALFRSLGRNDETARALLWYGEWEAESGNFRRAVEHMLEARRLESRDAEALFQSSDVASYYLALGEPARAQPHAREALTLAAKARHPILTPMAISYLAMIAVERDESAAAMLAGYAEERFRAADWRRVPYEQAMADRLLEHLEVKLSKTALARLLAEGAAWSEERAVAQALSV